MKTHYLFLTGLIIVLLIPAPIAAQSPQTFNKISFGDKQALDSIVTYVNELGIREGMPVDKNDYEYDSQGRVISSITYEWSYELQQWKGDSKEEYHYNASGLLSEMVAYWQDEASPQWLPGEKEEYTYENQKLIMVVYNSWDANNNQWLFNKKYETQYDANGNPVLDVEFYYNHETSQWEPHTKTEMDYNADNLVAEKRAYHYRVETAEWMIEDKLTYTYSNGDLIVKTGHVYFYDINEWRFSSERRYAYNGNHQMLSDTGLVWNQFLLQWDYNELTQHEYDDAGNEIMMINKVWDSNWQNEDKEEYIINAEGSLTELDVYEWNENTNDWLQTERIEANLNTDYTLEQLVLPFESYSFFYPVKQMLVSWIGYVTDGFNWYETASRYYYYATFDANGIDEALQNNVSVYPNPAQNSIYINTDDLKGAAAIVLFDQQGRVVLSQTVSANRLVSVSKLKNGLYLYRITQNGKITKGKLIIKK